MSSARVSPDPSTQAFQYPPPPSDLAATAAVPPDVPQHAERLLNSVLYISVHLKAASFVIREPAAQLCLTQTKHKIGVRPAKHRCRYVQD